MDIVKIEFEMDDGTKISVSGDSIPSSLKSKLRRATQKFVNNMNRKEEPIHEPGRL